ncbi:MAG: hypothetical protein HY684_06980, partial [Chloroflexi bacterium]|nr:hypothetical protein [Chloroflexota bacterium]
FNDIRVRKAFALATDVPATRDLALEGLGRIRGVFVHPAFAMDEKELRANYPQFQPMTQQKLAQAKDLLAQAGYPNGVDLSAPTFNDPVYIEALEVFHRQAKGLFRLKISSLETATAYQTWKGGRFDVTVVPASPAIMDPNVRAGEFFVSGAGRNDSGINDPKVNEYNTRSMQEADPAKRIQIVKEWERYMMDQYYWWYYVNAEYIIPFWSNVRNKYIPDITAEQHWQDVWMAQ